VRPVAVESDAVAAEVARPGAEGIVSRPRLFEQLGAARVTVVSAPAGSGKTVLLRSWIRQAGLTVHAAWVPIGRGERDPQPFWLSVLAALRQTVAGSALVQPLTAAPDLDGWAIVERLLADLAPVADRLWLVIDDVHELGPEALRQLELLIMRAPPPLRFALGARHDVRLGLHRLRLEGELGEIRGPDLRFTLAEAEELFYAARIHLPSLAPLVERAEGWAAGLRLAALSLAAHPDPERFAEQFSGTERTVADYLLAEVLDRQPEPVRLLLLRTSVLECVNGELADLLTGASGGERVLQDLEAANAFVVAVDGGRSWFRYHQMFADLLQLELRRSAPDEVTALHRQAADWLAGHGQPVQAIQQAQAARDWDLATTLLADHWPGLHLAGQDTTTHQLLAGFPAEARAADAELAVLTAVDELIQGSLEAAERYLGVAERQSVSVPTERSGQAKLLLAITRLLFARQRGDLPAVAEEAGRLQVMADAPDATQPGLGEDLRALALIHLGSAEFSAAWLAEGERHLDHGVALARRIGRPYLQVTGLAYLAGIEFFKSFARAVERGTQAVELAQRHGWADEPAAATASIVVGAVLVWQGRLEEAEPWVQRAERAHTTDAEPAEALQIRSIRGLLELARGRDADALAAFQAADRLAGRLAQPSLMVLPNRAYLVQTLVRLGETERAEQALAGFDDHDRERYVAFLRDSGREPTLTELRNRAIQRGDSHELVWKSLPTRIATAVLRLAQAQPHAAIAALGPVLDGSVPVVWPARLAQALLLEAIARDAHGDEGAAERALERALDLAEPDGVLSPFLLHPVPGLLERHARHRTAHPALIADILSLLAGRRLAPPPARPQPPLEALSDSEVRVLRYLPTNLSVPQIANELYVSSNTVRTHMRHVYIKLGTHNRADTVASARALGMLAPSPQTRQAPSPR
jgi:LuxR family maltose regulon positive regulatory protein